MPRFEGPLPSGLLRYWPVWLLLLAGFFGLAGLADAIVSRGLTLRSGPVLDFFAAVTRLGEGQWYILPSLVFALGFAVAGLLLRDRLARLAAIEISRAFTFFFATVALASLLANLLKRAIGRARPVEIDTFGPFGFQHFAFDWRWESFPSGHSTTIFAVALAASFLLPRLSWLLLAIAVLVGVSRVVVGAHYPTDVFGGALLGTTIAWAFRAAFASRRWVFRPRPGGGVVRRGFAATRRVLRR